MSLIQERPCRNAMSLGFTGILGTFHSRRKDRMVSPIRRARGVGRRGMSTRLDRDSTSPTPTIPTVRPEALRTLLRIPMSHNVECLKWGSGYIDDARACVVWPRKTSHRISLFKAQVTVLAVTTSQRQQEENALFVFSDFIHPVALDPSCTYKTAESHEGLRLKLR